MNCLAITVQFELHTYDISFVDEGVPLPNIGSKIELCKILSTTWFTKLDSKKKKRTYGILGVIVHEAQVLTRSIFMMSLHTDMMTQLKVIEGSSNISFI